jgi:hypothetical protein
MHQATQRVRVKWQVYWTMVSLGKLWIHAMLLAGVPKRTALGMMSAKWDDIERKMYATKQGSVG